MTALEFIHKHQNDEDNGECLILPDGSVEGRCLRILAGWLN